MACPFGSLTPPVLSYNSVSYDTSTMVHSHLIHLLRPYLTALLLTAQRPFPQRSIPDRERPSTLWWFDKRPTPSLPKGHPDLSGLLHLNYSFVDLQRTIYLIPSTNIQGTQRGHNTWYKTLGVRRLFKHSATHQVRVTGQESSPQSPTISYRHPLRDHDLALVFSKGLAAGRREKKTQGTVESPPSSRRKGLKAWFRMPPSDGLKVKEIDISKRFYWNRIILRTIISQIISYDIIYGSDSSQRSAIGQRPD